MNDILERLFNSVAFNTEGGGAAGGEGGDAGGDKGGENKGGDGGDAGGDKPFYADWKNEEAKALVKAKGYKTHEDIGIAYTNLNKLHNGSPHVIAWPKDETDEKGWSEVYTRLGVPAEPKDYAIKVPDGVQVNEGFMKAAQGWFHEAKLTPKQAQTLSEKWHSFLTEAGQKEQAEAKARDEAELAEFKAKTPDFEQQIVRGQRAARALGLDKAELDKLDAAVGVPAVMRLLAKIGGKIGEGNFIEGVNKDGFGQSPEEAVAEIARLRGDKAFTDSLLDPRHPMHSVNMEKWQDLQKRAFTKTKAA